jgi:multidrug resistance protein MdtO
VQILIAFYLINLSEFKVQTSLVLARDRVIGIFLGLLMMWLAFGQLWGAPAVVQMKRAFISTLRLLAQFAREPVSGDLRAAMERSHSLREAISKSFDSVRASADGVLFEFGPSREQDPAWRNKIREWQPQLRTLFLTRIALWKYRAQLPGFELPEAVRACQGEVDDESATMLENLADRMEGKVSAQRGEVRESFARLEQAIENYRSDQPPQLQTFVLLSRKNESLQTSLIETIDRTA